MLAAAAGVTGNDNRRKAKGGVMKLGRFGSVRAGIVVAGVAFAVAACTLDRSGTGGCPRDGGEVRCNISDIGYSFTSETNSYRFAGGCEVIDADGGSSFEMPSLSFKVAGRYERQSRKFTEAVDVKDQTNWSITGFSLADPWLNPSMPVGVSAVAGNPYSFAKRLCVTDVPSKYAHIPFSRNVILYMLSITQRLEMVQAAAQAASSLQAAPPPPPCPPALVTGPPQVVIPTEGLIYGGEGTKIGLALTSKCGAQNVDYRSSFYQAFFEHEKDGAWKGFRGFKVPMAANPQGGSLGSDVIPLNASGAWRVRARQIITSKNGGTQKTGDFSGWVQFQVGKPELNINKMDLAKVPRLEFDPALSKDMDAAWQSGKAKRLVIPK
jgi:hypothetical protein